MTLTDDSSTVSEDDSEEENESDVRTRTYAISNVTGNNILAEQVVETSDDNVWYLARGKHQASFVNDD